MSIFYAKQGLSSCQIGGAVSLAIIHDLQVNLSSLPGFPQVTVLSLKDGFFPIELSWSSDGEGVKSVAFELEEGKAFAAAKRFQDRKSFDRDIFESVQSAMARLEGVACVK
ncbi:hypothetical protein [Marinagarivorans cellulosilyticus]|uniref:Uncharacterized protein n=1 Tax=Marinagarivorans cellulosilyticus TaxID=2721545 RepID=A0AAN2BK83_9GAMM|nr:hypothetical protein [Marinagarivorans cellulosilyticus]BCD97744.1 hypothetical protein MARGE09_P1945 [Marinagarivorans cellulosilyticus]